MKILILSDDFPAEGCGGAEISTLDLANGLLRVGHEVFMITSCREKIDEGETDCGGLRVFKVFAKYNEKWRAYTSLRNRQTVNKIKKLIKEINPDIVHAHNIHYYLSYGCLKSAKELNKPVFLTARDTMLFTYGKLATKRYLEKLDTRISWIDNLKYARKRYNPFRNIAIRYYLKYVDKIFAISDSLKQALEANKIKNVEVIYNGVNVDDWETSQQIADEFKTKYNLHAKKVVFFGGRISGLKGAEKINQSMELVKKEFPEAVLLVAGTSGVGWLSG
ncbi:MAG: glycosyltransferase family 4 protein, partial [Candidatus Nealsonbacteria bacterium]